MTPVRLPGHPSTLKPPLKPLATLSPQGLPLWACLSGSGAKYVTYLGALLYLIRELGRPLHRVVGVSGGALIGALAATGKPIEECIEIARAINPGKHLDSNLTNPTVVTWPFNKKGVYAGDRLLGILREIFKGLKLGDLPIEMHIGTYNLNRGRTMIWGSQPWGHVDAVHAPDMELALLIRASISLPIFFDTVKLKHDQLIGGRVVEDDHVDGGVGSNFPLDFFGNSNRVVGLRFAPQDTQKTRVINNKIDVAMAMIDGMIDSTMRKHVEDALHAKQIIIDTGVNGLDFNITPEVFDTMVADGYRCAKAWAEKEKVTP